MGRRAVARIPPSHHRREYAVYVFQFFVVCSGHVVARVYHTFQQCMWGVYLVLALVYVIWGEKLYRVRRRKAVMSHYADRRFKPATGFLLFFLPVMFFVAMIITIVSLMK